MVFREFIKNVLKRIGINPANARAWIIGVLRLNIVNNYYHTDYDKNALLVYITSPFIGNNANKRHSNYWQSYEYVRILSDRGYNVDVISYDDPYAHLKKKYDLVIASFPRKVDCYHNHLKADAIKIAYFTTSSPTFNNSRELERIENLYKRTGVRVKAMRQIPDLTKDIYNYDATFFIGNHYNYLSFDVDKMPPVYYIHNHAEVQDIEFDEKLKNPRAFMFLGSVGQVHKGLDLLLEVFGEKDFPCDLYICSAYEYEKDFYELYKDHLTNRSNIHPQGVMDLDSDEFRQLAIKCCYMITPSCSEGKSGSVVDAMSFGMIPIVSRECGFDEDEAIILDNCHIDTIRQRVLDYAEKDIEWIRNESERIKSIFVERYTKKAFTDSVEVALDNIIR